MESLDSNQQPIRHILSLSGGKDSTALAIYMRDRIKDMEYVFCDTGEELPETKEYLDKLEVFLGKEINRLNPERPFSHYLQIYNGVLPDARTRWCTRKLKIEPFEKFVKNDLCYSYVGIRADEAHRKGYISTKPNIFPNTLL
jgi:3'-phosphoadenosine 5'-phosphosulfate sulfotransferase (PAPS reductase)/FAD synthetase